MVFLGHNYQMSHIGGEVILVYIHLFFLVEYRIVLQQTYILLRLESHYNLL